MFVPGIKVVDFVVLVDPGVEGEISVPLVELGIDSDEVARYVELGILAIVLDGDEGALAELGISSWGWKVLM